MKFKFIGCFSIFLLFSIGATVYAQSNSTSINGPLLKGIPEACYRIIAPVQINFRDEKLDSPDSNLNANERATAFRDETISQIQGMLARFEIPISQCSAESIKSMADIFILVQIQDSKKDDGKSNATVRTSFTDFVQSIHTNSVSKFRLFSSNSYSQALPNDKVIGYAFDEVRLQLFKLASEFRKQNAD